MPERRTCGNSEMSQLLPFWNKVFAPSDTSCYRKFYPAQIETSISNGADRWHTRAYLKKTTDYAIDPQARLFALNGSGVHAAHSSEANEFLSEERFYGDTFCGQIDLYGDVLGDGIPTLADLKTVGSYKAMKALGLESIDVETGEVYKTGDRKGQPKTRKEWVPGGRRDVREWALQLNAYRYLLEREGYLVGRMVVQLLVRDAGLEVAQRRSINRAGYIIEINRISDIWIERYFKLKSRCLFVAL